MSDFREDLDVFATDQKLVMSMSPTEYRRRMDRIKKQCEVLMKRAQGGDKREYAIVANAVLQVIENENTEYLRGLTQMNKMPVSIDEFIESPEFLGNLYKVWPTLRGDARAMNPDVFIGQECITESYLAGATNTGKSSLSIVTNLYQAYLTTCFDRPQRLFQLSDVTPLVFFFTSTSPTNADRTLYRPFRDLFLNMPYTQKWVEYDKYKEAQLLLGNGVQIYSASATVEAMVGQAIMSGIIDEVNFLAVVQKSMQAVDASGNAGVYDQAAIAYNTLSRRRESRFMTKGISIGQLAVASSVRYRGDFLDKRIETVINNKEPNRFWSRRKTYEVSKVDTYSGERFRLLVGGRTHSTRILEPDAAEGIDYPAGAQVEMVPIEFKVQFEADPENALRDVCGIATDSITPFITKREKINDAFQRAVDNNMIPFTNKQICNVFKDGMPLIYRDKLPSDLETGRYIHIDLGVKKDRCGISMVRPAGFKRVQTDEGSYEDVPYFEIELAVAIEPHAQQEIDIAEVRQWIMNLKNVYGIPIEKVTMDGFASIDTRQILTKAGIKTGYLSVDRTIEPYAYFKRCLYQDRVDIVAHDLGQNELSNVEYIASKDKVDHSPKLSKDVADSMVGAVFSASKARAVRAVMSTGVDTRGKVVIDERRRNPVRRKRIERR